MRYLSTVKMAEDVGTPPQALVEAMGAEMGEAFANGWIVDAGGLYPLSQSTEFRLSAGSITTTDGPFTEAKEVAGGYAIIQADSDEQARALARRVVEIHLENWPGWEGSVELRRIAEPEEGPPHG